MRRAEELQEWIAQVTEQPTDSEHLSVVLQDGQLLCILANAIDPHANLKVNKLTTVFHSKTNIRVFLEWCQRQGLKRQDLFEPDALLESSDFGAILHTLSILFEKFGGFSRHSIDSHENPLSDSESQTSTESSYVDTSPQKKINKKLASFIKVKNNLLSRKKSKKSMPVSPEGTPPNTPPPMSPPDDFHPRTPPQSPPSRRKSSETGNASRLNDFLSQVPPSQQQPLEHVQRPGGPPKRAPSRKEKDNRPKTPPRTPSPNSSNSVITAKAFIPLKPRSQASERPNKPRNKFAAFVQATPPSAVVNDMVTTASSRSVPKTDTFSDRKAVFSPKSTPKPVVSAPMWRPDSKGDTSNKLHEFMSMQPATTQSDTKARSDSTPNKLAAFLATTGTIPTLTTAPTAASGRTATASISSFNPHATSATRGGARNQTPLASSTVTKRSNTSSSSSRIPFIPRQQVERSTGRCTYVRKRQTYWQNRSQRSRFSLEEKRKLFMNEQLLLKEEQRRQQAQGGSSAKQNLIVQGVQCYVPDEEEVWLYCEIADYNERTKEVTVEVFLDNGERERRLVDLKDPHIIRALAGPNATGVESLPIAIVQDTMDGVEDMRLLRYLNEPSILFNLKQRFQASNPYTYTNDIVIAVNPYKWIDGLYGDHLHDKYLTKPRDSLSPHVYSTSTAAYKHMTKNDVNQSILVSGESGAGKTETTKIVMNHLASVAGGRKDKTIAKVIDVNPLLESFGNAKTTRNDNSSRFGKFTQLQFNDRSKLIGAKCETYLLEKSRVVSIADGERNYHIFYQMLAGLSSRELNELNLDASYAYQYTGSLREMTIPGMDDAKWLERTKKSLSLIGLDARGQKTLFQILSGVLQLGEIQFAESGESGSSISTNSQLSLVAQLFGLPSKNIEDALCNRTVITRNDAVTVPLDTVEAVENRDALAKTIYSKMFDWMVQKINAAISSEESAIHGQIGVLDIFGFEDFAQNGFEQFCINYANEKLQQKFTTDVFKTVEDEYIREGLEWDHIQYQDNKDIVEVIEGKMGVIALMNDHLRQPRGTEEALVNKIKTNHHKKPNGDVNPHIDFPKVKRTQFIINHYAGSVTYETVGFMEKHSDTLQNDLLDLIQSSTVDMIVELFDEVDDSDNGPRSKGGMKSLGSQFKHSLKQLMENIKCTNTHYVRCIKPNSNKSSTEFNKRMVVEQLRSAGVIEAIRITRSGYPSRLTPQELASRYCIVFPPSMHSNDVRRTCSIFMTALGRKAPLEYQMGKTLIYFKSGVMEELEAMKSDFLYLEATCIQKVVLGFMYRRRYGRMVRAAIVIQSYIRMALERQDYCLQRQAIIKIQRSWQRYINVPIVVEVMEDQVDDDESSESDFNDSFRDSNNQRSSTGGQWVDEVDGADDDSTSRPQSVMDRLRAFTRKNEDNIDTPSSRDRTNSMKRVEELAMKAKSMMRLSQSSATSSGLPLEEENSMLRIENRNLKYDLELMREQCIELQAIILEINKSRKR